MSRTTAETKARLEILDEKSWDRHPENLFPTELIERLRAEMFEIISTHSTICMNDETVASQTPSYHGSDYT